MELTHTLEVKPNLFIRAFIKFYDLNRKDPELNTCNASAAMWYTARAVRPTDTSGGTRPLALD